MTVTLATVPFNRPAIAPQQLTYLQQCIESGHLAGDGPFTQAATRHLSELHGGAPVLLTPSCTAALELSALLLGLEPGDEVIVPSFTFSSTAAAFALMGATIVFGDIEPEGLGLDPDQAAQLITEHTRAIVVVHYGGVPASPRLRQLAGANDLLLIEDNAHGLFGRSDGRPLGTLGDMSTLSFHHTKNLSCGEGGAIVLNDPALQERAEILREKGTDRARFFRGEIDKYSWVDVGSSYLLADLNAALLLAQLEFAPEIQRRRQAAWDHYRAVLGPVTVERGVRILESSGSLDTPSYHLFAMIMPDNAARTTLLAEAKKRGIGATFHYVPLDTSQAGRRVGSAPLGCPVTAELSGRLIRLPLFSDVLAPEYERVAGVVAELLADLAVG